MRTTLNIDDDVLQAAKELARRQGKTAGGVISELVRRALNADSARASTGVSTLRESDDVLGFRPFPSRGGVVTNELIDRLRDEGTY